MSERGSGHDAAQALVAIEQHEVTLAAADDAIIAVRVQSGDIYVPLRPVCEQLGVEPQAQTRRIRRDEVLAEGLRPVQVETKVKPRWDLPVSMPPLGERGTGQGWQIARREHRPGSAAPCGSAA